jgi:hypothetical protein
MPLVRRRAARNTPVKMTYAATHPGARTRTVTRDYLDSYLSTILTVSTLLVGIGTAQYGLLTWGIIDDGGGAVRRLPRAVGVRLVRACERCTPRRCAAALLHACVVVTR